MNQYFLLQIENLNNPKSEERLNSLRVLKNAIDKGDIQKPLFFNDVNNHIHTNYSFSPYSPTKALFMAYMNGLKTAGIMDHDSAAGCEEFIQAGAILDMPITCGIEVRVRMDKTELNGIRINNPDQDSVAYVALHGIPHQHIKAIQDFMAPYREARNKRNQMMCNKINDLFGKYDIFIDFEKDVLPLSLYQQGGSVTERHISYALALKMIDLFQKGKALVSFYKQTLKLPLSEKNENLLSDENNPVYEFDLLGAIKSDLISLFYVDAYDECPDVKDIIALCNKTKAISAYAYLGDVKNSVTGDKKPQKFEDSYIDKLFYILKELGFNAVTYMPSRNTKEQLVRVKALC
ncbi:MAG TPA: PHP domain-containing protein, partial [Clostridia bacterium]|nr:PHP domain-containing protein [Clostridia bacterium]